MLGWLFRGSAASWWVKDTAKTVAAVRQLPVSVQQDIGRQVEQTITLAMIEMERAQQDRGDDVNNINSRYLSDAKGLRHWAMQHGATERTDPQWACAALLESWFFSNSGAIGMAKHKKVHSIIFDWLNELPSDED